MKLLWLFCLSLLTLNSVLAQKDRVLLEKVSALTFRKGHFTTGRRSSPVPQLNCVNGDCDSLRGYEPEIIQCRNVGLDSYGEVQWKCEANIDSHFELGTTDVSCEGYSSREDPYILAGSCGLEYTVRQVGGGRGSSYSKQDFGSDQAYYPAASKASWVSSGVKWILFAFLFYCLFLIVGLNKSGVHTNSYPSQTAGRSYSYFDSFPNRFGYAYPNSADGPGFWSGLGLGGLAGYTFGSRRNDNTYDYGRNSFRSNNHSSRSFSASSSPAASSHASTGYGSTKRR